MTDARIAGAAKPPLIALDLATPRIRRRAHGDGGFILESEEPLGSYADHAGLLLQKHAGARPDAVFIAERSVTAADGWRRITYGEAWAAARRIAQSLLDRGLGQQDAILILSGNSKIGRAHV